MWIERSSCPYSEYDVINTIESIGKEKYENYQNGGMEVIEMVKITVKF